VSTPVLRIKVIRGRARLGAVGVRPIPKFASSTACCNAELGNKLLRSCRLSSPPSSADDLATGSLRVRLRHPCASAYARDLVHRVRSRWIGNRGGSGGTLPGGTPGSRAGGLGTCRASSRCGEAGGQVPAAPSQGHGCLVCPYAVFNRQCAASRSFIMRGQSTSANPRAARQRLAMGVIAHFEAAPPTASGIPRARNRP
jgi:hypothetical protein